MRQEFESVGVDFLLAREDKTEKTLVKRGHIPSHANDCLEYKFNKM